MLSWLLLLLLLSLLFFFFFFTFFFFLLSLFFRLCFSLLVVFLLLFLLYVFFLLLPVSLTNMTNRACLRRSAQSHEVFVIKKSVLLTNWQCKSTEPGRTVSSGLPGDWWKCLVVQKFMQKVSHRLALPLRVVHARPLQLARWTTVRVDGQHGEW